MLIFAQDYVEGPAAAVAAVRAPNRGDARCMARNRQPIVHGGTNPASLERWITPSLVTRNQQQNPVI
jgi:hypothetical protein